MRYPRNKSSWAQYHQRLHVAIAILVTRHLRGYATRNNVSETLCDSLLYRSVCHVWCLFGILCKRLHYQFLFLL